MRKILFFIFFVLNAISLIGCVEASAASSEVFSEYRAISMVIKDHPEFPSNKADTITNKLPIGGNQTQQSMLSLKQVSRGPQEMVIM